MKVEIDNTRFFDVSYDICDRPSDFEITVDSLDIEVSVSNENSLTTEIFTKLNVKTDDGSVEFERTEITEDLVLGVSKNQYAIYLRDMKVSNLEIDEISLNRVIEELEECYMLLTFFFEER